VLEETNENQTYYIKLVSDDAINTLSGYLLADMKPIKIIPWVSGETVSPAVDKLFRLSWTARQCGVIFQSHCPDCWKLNASTARCFRIDWSAAANSNYPNDGLIAGLQGSRFIKPAGLALKKLIVDERGVPPPKISVWGHSWGS